MTDEEQRDADRVDLVKDWGQGLVEVLVSNELVDHIPVVKTISAVFGAVRSVRDAILIQKLKDFLGALQEVPIGERVAMVQQIQAEPGYRRRVGEHLVELLDRVDGHRKPTMIGQVFAAYAQGQIRLTMVQRLNAAIERLPAHEIDVVRMVRDTLQTNRLDLQQIDSESIYAMINAGLAYSESSFGGDGLKVTATGLAFLDLQLDKDSRQRL
ncbi:MAG TPA: hypothetical protein VGN07_16070 [Steroidobacteraceae bacterium]|jgi:hypothetical protein